MNPLLPRRLVFAAVAPALGFAALATATTSSAQVPPTTLASSTTTVPNTSPHPTISIAPTSGLRAGDVITVSVAGRFGFTLEETRMQICSAAVCATAAPAPDADALVVRTEPAEAHVTSARYPFRVGVGQFRAADGTTFTCGPASCRLDVSATGVGLDGSMSATLTYAGAPTSSTVPPTTDPPGSTTSTTAGPTTSGTRPIPPSTTRPTTVTTVSPLCRYRSLIPAWLWELLVQVFGVAC